MRSPHQVSGLRSVVPGEHGHPTTAPIDAFAPVQRGRYVDPLVVVEALPPGRPERSGRRTVRTPHFDLTPVDGRVLVSHRLAREAIDDDLAGLLTDELFRPGWLRGADLFERVFTGVVRTSAEDAVDSWELFYRNTLARLGRSSAAGDPGSGNGSIAAYAPVHDHALGLLRPGSVLELGCGFGLLALRIAGTGRRTIASDVSPGTVHLLRTVAPRLGVELSTATADAARFPAEDGCADTVLAVHLLEQLDPAHGTAVVTEAVRLARQRVVVAVPLEEEADEPFGHVRTVSLDDLHRWGRGTGLAYDVHEHHGGWLVIDR
jgi:SAM-dependent methyltransferase